MSAAPARGASRAHQGDTRLPPILVGIALLALTLPAVLAFPDAALVADSGRDIANAWAIARGDAWPLSGPEIYGAWKLGPVWFYVLAVPLALGASLGTLALWIGLLASLKIPLAFALGRRCYGDAGGLLFGAAIALPGWNSAGAMLLAHTAVVESAVLATVLLAWRAWERPRALRLALAAGLFSLALHAHPTAIVIAPWLIAAAYSAWREPDHTPALLAALLAFVVPWLPMLHEEMRAGWPQLGATADYVLGIDPLERLRSVVDVTRGLVTGWADLVADFLLPPLAPLKPVLAVLWYLALGLGAIGAITGGVRDAKRSALIVAQLLLALIVICLLRLGTPVYMAFVLFPLAAWAWTHGLHALLPTRALRITAWSVYVLALVLQGALVLDRNAALEQGSLAVPGEAFADVRAPVRSDGLHRFWLAAVDQEPAAAHLCGDSFAVHGELAGVLALASGVATERVCGDARVPRFGGRDSDEHLAGFPRAHADALGLEGRPLVRGWVGVPVARVIHPFRGRAALSDSRYVVEVYRDLARRTARAPLGIAFECTAGELVVVANQMPAFNPLSASATLDGRALDARFTSVGASYFDCSTRGRVQLALDTLDPQAVDVITLRATPEAPTDATPVAPPVESPAATPEALPEAPSSASPLDELPAESPAEPTGEAVEDSAAGLPEEPPAD